MIRAVSRMRSLKIGLVDLDTSHPGSWIPILRDMGHEISGVYDGGVVYPKEYAGHFAQKNGIDRVFDTLESMAEIVDVAIIHSCNWDLHIQRAMPFIKAKKAVFIDKPMIGNLIDLQQMMEWESQGVRLYGGSSLHWCKEVLEWNATHDRSEIIFAVCGCSVDEFNYGIHAYSLLHSNMGRFERIRHLGTHIQQQIEIVGSNGLRGQVVIGATQNYLPMYATIVTQQDVVHFQVDPSDLYRSQLEIVLPYLAGETSPPMPLSELLEVERAAIAAQLSLTLGGKEVFMAEMPLDAGNYDGMVFAIDYARMKQ